MLIDTWATVQNLRASFEDLSPAQINAMSFGEWAARTGRQAPAESATAALDAQYQASAPTAPQQPPAAAQEPAVEPQGLDLASMPMSDYAALRSRLGIGQSRQEGIGVMNSGAGSSDWVRAAQQRGIGRTQYGQQNVQDADRIDAGKYLRANEPVTGRTGYYR